MVPGWGEIWTREPGAPRRGGQGTAFIGRDSNGGLAFIKELNRPRNMRARKRFVREATAYETLEHPGIPRLLHHNAGEWRHVDTPLFLALEVIDGPTLASFMSQQAMPTPDQTIAAGKRLADIVEYCHVNDIVHRDLKPGNIVLRDGEIEDPVIVDFGLSFNDQDAESSDLTRLDEEVGNRFLRLPEHSTGGRSPISDVTQLVGIFFYLLVGAEPRTLVDADGNKPHQRPATRAVLEARLNGRRLSGTLSLFDRGFDPRLVVRYQTAALFREALESTLAGDEEAVNFQELINALDRTAGQQRHVDIAANAALLGQFTSFARERVLSLARGRGIAASWGGGPDDPSAETPFALLRLAFVPAGMIADSFTRFRFELRGPRDVVLLVEDTEAWRGSSIDDPLLEEAIFKPVIEAFIGRG